MTLLIIEGRESLLDNIPIPQNNLRVRCTDRTDVIFWKVFKFCPWFNATVGFSACFIVDIIAHGTDIPGRPPFFKAPLANLAFSLKSTYRAEICFGKIFEGRACRNAIMRFPAKG